MVKIEPLDKPLTVTVVGGKLLEIDARIAHVRAKIQELEQIIQRDSISLEKEKEQLLANLGAAQALKELSETFQNFADTKDLEDGNGDT